MPNPFLLYGLGKGLSTLSNYFGQKSAADKQRKLREEEIARLQGIKGKDYINVNGAMSAFDRKAIVDASKYGSRIDKSLNLDTGQAQGGALENLQSTRLGTLGDLRLRNEVGTAQRNERLDQAISGLKTGMPSQPSTTGLLTNLAGIGINTFADMVKAKQSQQIQQQAFNEAPKGTYDPSAFDTGYQTQKPSPNMTVASPFAGYNIESGIPAQDPYNIDALKFQQQELQNQLLQQKLDKGNVASTSKVPDYNSKVYPFFESIRNKDMSGFDKWLKDNPNQYRGDRTPMVEGMVGQLIPTPSTIEDYRKVKPAPDYGNVFDLKYGDLINRKLGAGAADSVYNNFASEFGFQPRGQGFEQPTPQSSQFGSPFGNQFGGRFKVEQWGSDTYGSEWNNLTDDEKMRLYQTYGNTQLTR